MAYTKHFTACKYNQGVDCETQDRCDRCGWNPQHSADRKARRLVIRKKVVSVLVDAQTGEEVIVLGGR